MSEQEMIPALAADVYDQMTAMVTGHWVSQTVRAVVDLSLADHLSGQRLTAAEVADREGSAPNTTFRLMRAMKLDWIRLGRFGASSYWWSATSRRERAGG